jgi:hypothetical protein
MDTGSLSVLNVGAGDIEVRFNPHQPEEMNRALRMLTDMQKRGYAILVKQDDGSYARATAIDASTHCYVIAGEPETAEQGADLVTGTVAPKKHGRYKKQPIATSHAVGVARSAGG